MAGEKKRERWTLRLAEGNGLRARWAMRRLFRAGAKGDQSAREVIALVAHRPEHRQYGEAKQALAAWWAETRDPWLRQTVIDTGAIAPEGLPRLLSAALNRQLTSCFTSADTVYAVQLISDSDPHVRASTVHLLGTVDGLLHKELWRVGFEHPELREALLANPELPAEAEYKALWFEYLNTLDPDLHSALRRWPLTDDIKQAIGARWAATRRPELRTLVQETEAVASENPARLLTLALLDRLAENWRTEEATFADALLNDSDQEVKAHATAYCRKADGEMLAALWGVERGSGSPLRALLLQNPAPPPHRKLNSLWATWIKRPSDELWEVLAGWGRPAASGKYEPLSVVAIGTDPILFQQEGYRRALIEALAMREHPISEIAVGKFHALRDQTLVDMVCEAAQSNADLVPFCKEHRLAPKDPVKRVVFFLLTGQPEQHHGMDPDGSLLSLAYASVSQEDRIRVRQAMLAAGELDLVRVIVGDDRRAQIQNMTSGEIRYLAEQLAHRKEWANLWTLVQDLPIGVGIRLMRLFEGWAPRDEDGRRVYELFREADPAEIEAAYKRLDKNWPLALHQATIHFHGRVNDVSFASDAPLLAVAGGKQVAGVIDLSAARLVERYGGFRSSVGRVLHVGRGAVIAAERTSGLRRRCRIVRCAEGDVRTLYETKGGSVTSLALTSDDGAFAAGTRSGRLVTAAPLGGPVTSQPVTAFGLREGDWPRSIAAHRRAGQIAVLGRWLCLTDPSWLWSVLARVDRVIARADFIAAGTLVCAEQSGTIRIVRFNGRQLGQATEMRVDGLGGLATSPESDRLVVADLSGDLHFFKSETFEPDGTYRTDDGERATGITISPSGDFLAMGHDGGRTDLFDLRVSEVPDISLKPMVNLVPRHLGIVDSARKSHEVHPEVRKLLELLHTCLEYRFRFDIEIGDAVALSAGEYDISL
ncbi:hypothetical protein F8568_044720 [Actinomadura sp. LD22]|uniref:Uncharacterized protein n=1 Tax=Actinomadura physcomitrii TaxID=2650748 RepID=A0A6I4MY41_9ACTN|nr:hypothetical protein [Actinomadura physcomitrii]MWA07316.1 hypothetical protein [Actinomadura physcomitrii]